MVTTKYEAKDGTQFGTQQEAQDWDNHNFTIWLEGNPLVAAKDFVEIMAAGREDEYYTTERKIARQLLRKYWDKHVP